MRVGIVSAPLTATSGYGRVAKEICFGLADAGYDVVNVGGRMASVVLGERFYVHTPKDNRILVLPAWGQTGDKPTLEYYIRRYELDAIISIYDAYVLNFGKPSKPWSAQFPIDTEITDQWRSYILAADYLIAMSKFGEQQLLKDFPDFMVRYIPHGVNTSIFKPRSEEEKLEIRRKWHIPDDIFLMLNVSANWGERKCLPQLMVTFKRFLEKHKRAALYLNTNLGESCPQGYNLIKFAEQLGIADHVMGPTFNPILDPAEDEALAELYSAADVYVSSSFGEGFGLPLLESMSCGVPVIAPRNSSQIELAEGNGWMVENVPTDMWEDVPVWMPLLACLPPETMIDTPYGFFTIEQVVEYRIPYVYGFKNGVVVPTKVYAWMYREVDEDLIYLETESSSIMPTKEHPVWADERWIPIKHLKEGMVTLNIGNCNRASPRKSERTKMDKRGRQLGNFSFLSRTSIEVNPQSFSESFTNSCETSFSGLGFLLCEEKKSEVNGYMPTSFREGLGLFSRSNRRRGDDNYCNQTQKESFWSKSLPFNALYLNLQHKQRDNKLGQRNIFFCNDIHDQGSQFSKIHNYYYGLPNLSIPSQTKTVLTSSSKNEICRTNTSIHRVKVTTSRDAWIHQRRNRNSKYREKFKPRKETTVSIGRHPYKGKVFNLATKIGNYFANGILVHNCYPVPNLNSLLQCMEDAYLYPEKRKVCGRVARAFALKYDWTEIIPKWDALLKEMVT